MSVATLMDRGLEGDVLVTTLAAEMNDTEVQARFVLAVVSGQLDGDVVELDSRGRRLSRQRMTDIERERLFGDEPEWDLARRDPDAFRELEVSPPSGG
jgi:hypothetical protein